ncbi:hypothetical protein GCM10018954_077570 [Kutzneria kofuensis]
MLAALHIRHDRRPKGVPDHAARDAVVDGACYAPTFGLSEQDTIVWPLPLHHAYALSLAIVGSITAARTPGSWTATWASPSRSTPAVC